MAGPISGRKVAVGIGKESTRGTAVAATYWVKHLEQNLHPDVTKALNESGLGVLDKYNDSDIMKQLGAGEIGGKITDKSFGLILAAAFGAAPTTTTNSDVSGNVKDHTYAQSQSNQPLTLTLSTKDANRDEQYAMAVLASLDVEVVVGEWAKFKATFISKAPANATNTVSYVAENEFKPKHAAFKLASSLAGLNAASAVSIKSFKFTVDRVAEDYPVLGSVDPSDIFSKELQIKGDITLLFDSLTHRTSYLADTEQAARIDLINSDVTIGTAAHPEIKIDFAKIAFSEWSTDEGLDAMVEQTIGFQALYSLSDAKTWQAVITNLVTSY